MLTFALLALPFLLYSTTAHPQLSPRDLGTVNIQNKCTYPLYISSVDAKQSPAPTYIAPGSAYTEPVRSPACDLCGVSLKISKSPDLGTITQFEYSLKNGLNWYDISFVNCAIDAADASQCPGWDGGLTANAVLAGNYGGCETFHCPKAQQCPGQAFYIAAPTPEPVFACGIGASLKFVACADE